MYVARLLYPVEVLGPGKRIGIWFCGCPHHCEGCSNPELWNFQDRYNTTVEQLMHLIHRIADKHVVDGFTLTGGDPMYQPEAVQKLIPCLQEISDDILVYTGYHREELSTCSLQGISVLIDGPYIQQRNNNCLLRGSDNQRIYILDESSQSLYKNYLSTARNQIQNFMTSDGVVSVGIHRPDFQWTQPQSHAEDR